jgi:hypothetical protein
VNEQQAERLIPATTQALRTVLLDPAALPDWNPALRSVAAGHHAETGVRHRVTALAGLSGHLEYLEIGERRITVHLKVQGMREDGWWLLTPQGSGTRVEHGFAHGGPLARLLSGPYRGVAQLRLQRLDERVRAVSPSL